MLQPGSADFGIVPLTAPDGIGGFGGGGWRNCYSCHQCFSCHQCHNCHQCFNCHHCFNCHQCWGGWGR